jgi:acyl carrier protein
VFEGFLFMDRADIYEKLTRVFRDVLDDDVLEITPEMTANDVEDWDSLSHVRLILSVERIFDIHFSIIELAQFDNVGQLTDMIADKIKT